MRWLRVWDAAKQSPSNPARGSGATLAALWECDGGREGLS